MCLVLNEIGENLTGIENQLNQLKDKFVSTDKDYHICEIYTHIARIRYHLLQIDVIKKTNAAAMTKEQKTGNSCDVPAPSIENKLNVPNTEINFRDRKMRKASSWKYLVKWESILEEQWDQQSANEYDFRGINLVVPKRKQSIKRHRQPVSSTKEDFLDDSCMKKSNSAECILDRDDRIGNDHLEKKCVSENDLNRDSLGLHYCDMYDSNYLLSLKDIETIGHLKSIEKAKPLLTASSKSAGELNRSNSSHKPKIVGVIYKMRL